MWILKKEKKDYILAGKHTLKIKGGELEYYVHGDIKRGAIIPIFFHAAIDRNKIVLPRFEGVSMCQRKGWSGISFADPALAHYDKCSLAWFLGNDRYPTLQKDIHKFLKKISRKYNLTFVFHGGSGGGYAALVQKSFFANKHFAIVQNPQTNIFDLSKQHVINYFKTYEKEPNEKDYEKILNKYHIIYKIYSNQLTDVLYFQNQSDELHMEKHLKTFLQKPYSFGKYCIKQDKQDNLYFIGNWGVGHAILPGDVLEKLLNHIICKRSFKGIKKHIVSSEKLQIFEKDQYMTNILQ